MYGAVSPKQVSAWVSDFKMIKRGKDEQDRRFQPRVGNSWEDE